LTPAAEVALKEALEVLRWDTRTERTFFANLVLEAACAAVVRDGRMPMPAAVEFRIETPEETMIRLACLPFEALPSRGAL